MNITRILILALLLSACSKSEPTVSFGVSLCVRIPLQETRLRRINTSCAVHGPSHRVGHTWQPGPCVSWHKRTIHERLYTLQCARNEWYQDTGDSQ
jgi:hypothetical protein